MKPLTLIFRLGALAAALAGSPAALSITMPSNAKCYAGNWGYDTYIANNTSTSGLSAYYTWNNGGSFYITGTGTFNTAPPASVIALSNGAFCYSDHKSFRGNWLAYTIGSSAYAFNLQFWGSDGSGQYYQNVSGITGSGLANWTVSGNCPGTGSGLIPAIAAVNTSSVQTICNEDYIVTIDTAYVSLNTEDNGAFLNINDNPAANAGGSQQSYGGSAAADAVVAAAGAPVAAGAREGTGRYALGSRLVAGQRWSLVRDPKTGGVSGLRYAADGVTPLDFVSCRFQQVTGGPNPFQTQSSFMCRVAPACPTRTCGKKAWKAMNPRGLILPGSFFDRPLPNLAAAKIKKPSAGGDKDVAFALAQLPAPANRTARKTPDGKNIVVTGQVAGQAWMLNLTGGNRRLFAAIPHGALGKPRFLDCSRTSGNAKSLTFACAESYSCDFGPCTDAQWTPVPQVTLPRRFFKPAS